MRGWIWVVTGLLGLHGAGCSKPTSAPQAPAAGPRAAPPASEPPSAAAAPVTHTGRDAAQPGAAHPAPPPAEPGAAHPAPLGPRGLRTTAALRSLQLASTGKLAESLVDYAEGAVWDSVGRSELSGRAAILQGLQAERAAFPNMKLEPVLVLDLGEQVPPNQVPPNQDPRSPDPGIQAPRNQHPRNQHPRNQHPLNQHPLNQHPLNQHLDGQHPRNQVVVLAVRQGTHDGPLDAQPATHKAMAVETALVFSFDAEGKVTRVTEYFDEQKQLAQLGLLLEAEGLPRPPLAAPPSEAQVVASGAGPSDTVLRNVVAAKALVAALKRDSFAAALREALSPDFTQVDPMTGATRHGAEELISALGQALFAVWPNYRATPRWAAGAGDWVVMALDNEATYAGGLPGIAVQGQHAHFRSLELFRYQAGKVARYRSFSNGQSLLQTLRAN